ncbi:MAG: 4-hydroxy-tetrahydrodipicolinate reductase [Flavobacteriales bacterium]|nr:4-hydroxy-tetrahydrodipicolinate reductase [Flavobacteriales bacterium]
MKIALYGHGRMGKAIEAVCGTRGHDVVLAVGRENSGTPPIGADVAIEFSVPDQAIANIDLCLQHGVPVVVGTTGWYDQLPRVEALVASSKGALLWASNFSLGVNLMFRLNRMLASLIDPYPAYGVHIDEVHHVHKLDAPSGTALTLARDIDLHAQRFHGWRKGEAGEASAHGAVPIISERKGEVLGKHSVSWTSEEDRLVLTHEAFGRTGFAAGAVIAAEWLLGRTGTYTMDDVLSNP